MKLLKVDTLKIAREKLLKAAANLTPTWEFVDLSQAAGRILVEDIYAGESIPAFHRAVVDGYAVKATNTEGSSESLPVFLTVVGDVAMGTQSPLVVEDGCCAYVPTGGMLPAGADAVVMEEYCEAFEDSTLAVYTAVAPGAGVAAVGEDIEKGQFLLRHGHKLMPQDIGALAAVGIYGVNVYQPWKVTVISTGDELVTQGETLQFGQIRDINTYTLSALARKWGLQVVDTVVLEDNPALLQETIQQAFAKSDVILCSGGSSQGRKDVSFSVMNQVADQGVLTHGLALKPGKPTITAYDSASKTLVFGLPGHPAAAMIVSELLVHWIWKEKTSRNPLVAMEVQGDQIHVTTSEYFIRGRLTANIPGAPGRMTCQLVRLESDVDEVRVIPIFGKSGSIFTLVQADGYVILGENQEGLLRGQETKVYIF